MTYTPKYTGQDIQKELTDLIMDMQNIKSRPPNMYHWTPNDAWMTAIRACIDKVNNLRNKLL